MSSALQSTTWLPPPSVEPQQRLRTLSPPCPAMTEREGKVAALMSCREEAKSGNSCHNCFQMSSFFFQQSQLPGRESICMHEHPGAWEKMAFCSIQLHVLLLSLGSLSHVFLCISLCVSGRGLLTHNLSVPVPMEEVIRLLLPRHSRRLPPVRDEKFLWVAQL